MFMVGLTAAELTAGKRKIFRDCAFGGFILYRHNLSDPEQIVELCRALWNLATEHPPFIAIDAEGGGVHRLPKPFTRFPAAALIGRKNDPGLAYRLGKACAEELTLAGINLNFAPVLDVNSNPENPLIGDRAFASDPARVIRVGNSWMQGLRDGGIIPCGKHFPGHGATDKDSHVDLPTVTKSWDELRSVEIPPFVQASRNRIEALMTAHVLYPSLDARFPATLSHAIVTGLLRRQLRYEGVVFSDDMEMKAITESYGSPDAAALLAARAGVDVLLYGHEPTTAVEAFERLCAEADRDAEIATRVEQSYQRITALKHRRLKMFTAVAKEELTERLAQLHHQRIIDEVHGIL